MKKILLVIAAVAALVSCKNAAQDADSQYAVDMFKKGDVLPAFSLEDREGVVRTPEDFAGKRLILHFGAVDQVADVWVNEQHAATHVGGYLSFEADVSSALADGKLSIVVRVTDDTDRGFHTRGKQKTKRGGIWYTPQSGIWQSVWLAPSIPDSTNSPSAAARTRCRAISPCASSPSTGTQTACRGCS